eukprot:491564_1
MCQCSFQSLMWWIFGGAIMAIFWWIFGWLCCCCPCGDNLRAIGSVAWNPYAKQVDVGVCGEDGGCDGICDCGVNLIWMITLGWIFFLFYCILAILTLPFLCCGWDFSAQHWKLARLSLFPSGADIHKSEQVSQDDD